MGQYMEIQDSKAGPRGGKEGELNKKCPGTIRNIVVKTQLRVHFYSHQTRLEWRLQRVLPE